MHVQRLLAARALFEAGNGATIKLNHRGPHQLKAHPGISPGHLLIRQAGLKIVGPPTGAIVEQTALADPTNPFLKAARVFEIDEGASAEFSNITITGGEAANNSEAQSGHIHGGGIHNHGSMSLRNVTLTGNNANSSSDTSSGGGGAIYSATGTLAVLNNVTIVDNDATRPRRRHRRAGRHLPDTRAARPQPDGWRGRELQHPSARQDHQLRQQHAVPEHDVRALRHESGGGPVGALATDGTHPLPAGSSAIDFGDNADCVPMTSRHNPTARR